MSEEKQPFLKQYIDALSVGIHFALSIFVGFGMGYMLDRWLKTSPWLTIVFFVFGVIAGFSELLRVARKQNGSDKDRP